MSTEATQPINDLIARVGRRRMPGRAGRRAYIYPAKHSSANNGTAALWLLVLLTIGVVGALVGLNAVDANLAQWLNGVG